MQNPSKKKLSEVPKKLAILCLVASAVAASSTSASAQMVGALFGNDFTPIYTGKGVLGESFTPLIDHTGTADGSNYQHGPLFGTTTSLGSGISLTLTGTGYSASNGTGPVAGAQSNLFDGQLNTADTQTNTFMISGLKPGDRYMFALYGGQTTGPTPAQITGDITGLLSGGSTTFTNTPGSNNYFTASVVAGASGTITFTQGRVPGGSETFYSAFTAVGLVDTSTVPEPSVWALTLGGVAMLVGLQKLRRLQT